jgi:hypothetical protein
MWKILKVNLEKECVGVDKIHLACEHGNQHLVSITDRKVFDHLGNYQLLKDSDQIHGDMNMLRVDILY